MYYPPPSPPMIIQSKLNFYAVNKIIPICCRNIQFQGIKTGTVAGILVNVNKTQFKRHTFDELDNFSSLILVNQTEKKCAQINQKIK
jgi:hypothetical protein